MVDNAMHVYRCSPQANIECFVTITVGCGLLPRVRYEQRVKTRGLLLRMAHQLYLSKNSLDSFGTTVMWLTDTDQTFLLAQFQRWSQKFWLTNSSCKFHMTSLLFL